MKKSTLILIAVVGTITLVSGACQGNVEPAKNTAATGANSSGNTMGQPMQDAETRRAMMQQMSKDPAMMREMMDQMMSDPKMSEMMLTHMNGNVEMMGRHMQTMMNNAEHRRAMVEMLRANKAVREQMRAVLDDADKAAAK